MRLNAARHGRGASLGMFATKAGAQETLRVGRAIANSWFFVPLDLGMATGIFAKHDLLKMRG
jgi:hypothetical protein